MFTHFNFCHPPRLVAPLPPPPKKEEPPEKRKKKKGKKVFLFLYSLFVPFFPCQTLTFMLCRGGSHHQTILHSPHFYPYPYIT